MVPVNKSKLSTVCCCDNRSTCIYKEMRSLATYKKQMEQQTIHFPLKTQSWTFIQRRHFWTCVSVNNVWVNYVVQWASHERVGYSPAFHKLTDSVHWSGHQTVLKIVWSFGGQCSVVKLRVRIILHIKLNVCGGGWQIKLLAKCNFVVSLIDTHIWVFSVH